MSQSITLSDELLSQLEATARQCGLASIEELIRKWRADDLDCARRAEAVRRITALRNELTAVYGEMPDSVDLIREDRDR